MIENVFWQEGIDIWGIGTWHVESGEQKGDWGWGLTGMGLLDLRERERERKLRFEN